MLQINSPEFRGKDFNGQKAEVEMMVRYFRAAVMNQMKERMQKGFGEKVSGGLT